MTAQVLFFNDFSEKDPHLNAIESGLHIISVYFDSPQLSIQ